MIFPMTLLSYYVACLYFNTGVRFPAPEPENLINLVTAYLQSPNMPL